MNIKEISEKCRGFSRFEDRSDTEDHLEVVFLNAETAVWLGGLSQAMGPAVKPAGKKPSRADSDVTKAFGGIYDEQTLFRLDAESGVIIAMLWPWQDRIHTTLKVFLVKK